ncbi:MAG: methyltransferase domain-containing protein [Acidobacteriota bacterium]|nr:methyltransferase domain-containing protein [Acidobacteriota bacterium]
MSTTQTTQENDPHAGQPTPERIFTTLLGYQQTAAMRAAIELDIFSAIAEGNDTPAKIAERCGCAERGARVLCDYMTIHGFLTKQGGRYALTPESQIFLVRTSPAYVGGVSGFLARGSLVEAYNSFTDSVRKGGTTMAEQGSMTPEHPMWEEFARSMVAMMRPPAAAIAQIVGSDGPIKVLDIAAGHGIFGVTVAQQNPQAQIYAVDWKNVLPYAQKNAEAAGVADRYHTIPGSAFEVDFGAGYDVVLITNFLHHFDPPTNETLLRKVHAVLKADGRAITLEFVPNEDRVTPPTAAAFSLTMLGSTERGDAYTFRELEQMFRNAGFARSEIFPGVPGSIIVSYKQ